MKSLVADSCRALSFFLYRPKNMEQIHVLCTTDLDPVDNSRSLIFYGNFLGFGFFEDVDIITFSYVVNQVFMEYFEDLKFVRK